MSPSPAADPVPFSAAARAGAPDAGAPAAAAPERTAARSSRAQWLVLAACLLLFGYGLAGTPFRALFDDVDRALIARNMADRGDWVTPWYHGRPLYTKPPLLYWLGAVSYGLLGRRDELPADLVSVLCATVAVLATWGLGRRLLGDRAALAGALTLATAYLFLLMARQPMIDMALTAGLTGCLAALARLRFAPPARPAAWWAAAAVGLAAAILAKGPLPLALFAAAALPLAWPERAGAPAAPAAATPASIAMATEAAAAAAAAAATPPDGPGRRRAWRRAGRVALFLTVVAGLVLPWFLKVGALPLAGQTWRYELLGRLSEASPDRPWPQRPWWFYLADMTNFLPWLLLLPAALALAWQRRRERRWLFLLAWGVGGLLLFSVSSPSKRSYYLLPLYPAFALMVGGLWAAVAAEAPAAKARAGAAARALFLGGAWLLAAALAGAAIAAPLAARRLALSPAALFAAGGAAAGVAGALAARALARRRPWRAWALLTAGVAIVELLYVGHVVPPLNTLVSGKAFFTEVAPLIGDQPAASADLEFSLAAFYLDRDDLQAWWVRDMDRDLARRDVRYVLGDPNKIGTRPGLEPVLARRYAAPLGGVREFALYRVVGYGESTPGQNAEAAPPGPALTAPRGTPVRAAPLETPAPPARAAAPSPAGGRSP